MEGLNDFQKEQVRGMIKEQIEKLIDKFNRRSYPTKQELKDMNQYEGSD